MLIEGPIVAERELGADRSEQPAMVGPHAVIHAVDVITERLGPDTCNDILKDAQIGCLPSGTCMVPEIEALRLHRWLALREPVESFAIAEEAAKRTGDYIIENRIPRAAVWLLQRLPTRLAARLLMAAIRKHAWTFIGAGRFEPSGGWVFTIDRTAADDPVLLPKTLFHWYAAVFERLYRRLVHPDCRCISIECELDELAAGRFRIVIDKQRGSVLPG